MTWKRSDLNITNYTKNKTKMELANKRWEVAQKHIAHGTQSAPDRNHGIHDPA
jgi:hypothetical protein